MGEDFSKVIPEFDSPEFLLNVESLNVLFVDIYFSPLLSNIPLDEKSSSYSLLDKVPPFDVETSEDRSTTENYYFKGDYWSLFIFRRV